MSILKLPPASIELPVADLQSAGGTSGAATPEAPFAAVLHDERARSGSAPGDRDRDRSRGRDSGRVIAGDGTKSDDASVDGTPTSEDDTPAASSTDPSAAVLAALLGGAPPAAVTAIVAENAAAPNLPGADGDANPGGLAVTPATGDAAPIPGAAATMPMAAVATPAVASAAALVTPGTSAAGTGSPDESIVAPTSAGANPQSVAPVAAPVPDDAPPHSMPDVPQGDVPNSSYSVSQGQAPAAAADANAAPTNAGTTVPAADAAAQAQAAPANAPAPQSPPGIGTAPAPLEAGAPAPTTSLPPSRTVGLDRAVETVRLALRAAADRGVTQARISLSPRELGGIEINLRHTSEGLVARVVAEHAGAAQLLQHAGAELRRALEAQGLTLLQLDIGASGQQDGRAAGEQRGFGETGSGRDSGAGRRTGTDGDDLTLDPAGDTAAPADTLALSNGVLIDVLA